ncbi:hypothetical protein PTSG_10634 [Salpingoeca rosetta]|uniref:START domain-containing protein n=1 Tax=Salpingoeca rosetta (strain ATCC 50818 / BSB-021) TaxID=946362 RepID=F2URX7_SALR5|nr:uncharacterized protein PTSG_10634 [Salpingoeca rosetta]EGD80382.1 hypothetical protein PTSG_10634 [Salpingoeca rosetta]|eukprot:XP_004988172.1 hypothetical protein PTSG_10634 [Salpingoeca rosetta]
MAAKKIKGDISWAVAEEALADTRNKFHAKRTAQGYQTVKDDGVVHMERLAKRELKAAGVEHKVECIRLTTVVDIPPSEATRLLNDYEVRKTWEDTLTKESRSDVVVLERDNQTVQVIRTLSNAALGGLISPREFIDLAWTEVQDDGSILHFAQSIDHPDFPHTKGFVRGVNFPCGMLYEPVPASNDDDDDNGGDGEGDKHTRTKLTYIIHSDVGGWLPASLVFKGTTTTMWTILQSLHAHIRARQAA